MVIGTILPDSSTSSKPAGAGFRLAGRLLTLAAAALFLSAPSLRAATATLTMQDSNFPTQFKDGGDFFNQGSTELGMWANSGNKNTAAWGNFTTSGFGGTARSLQVGDVFTITVSATRTFGQVGFSLISGGTLGTICANNISALSNYPSQMWDRDRPHPPPWPYPSVPPGFYWISQNSQNLGFVTHKITKCLQPSITHLCEGRRNNRLPGTISPQPHPFAQVCPMGAWTIRNRKI
jgi:hypothetical protein